MPYSPGDTVDFQLSPLPVGSSGSVYSYVWKFWDQSIQVGTVASTSKQINIGGDPLNGNRLIYACMPVMVDGQSGSIGGTIFANNAPFVTNVSISANDQYYGFSTVLSLTGYSIDGHTPLTFQWYEGTTLLGTGTAGATPSITHTWQGNDTTSTVTVTGQVNSYTATVTYDRTITCRITDSLGVITSVDFRLRGKTVPGIGALLVADANSTTTDATSQPEQRIGIGQTMTFVAYASDIDGVQPLFVWDFTVSRGWTVPYSGSGTDTALPDGSFSSSIVKAVATEIVSTGTAKSVTVLCTITGQAPSRAAGSSTQLQFDAILLKNNAPSTTTIACRKVIDGSTVDMTTGAVAAGTKLIYEAVSYDIDLDVVHQAWTFNNHPFPTTLKVYGPKIILDTGSYAAAAVITGNVVSTDRMGATLTTYFSGPTIS